MNIKLLKQLCDIPGIPGDEGAVRDFAVSELRKYTKDISVDVLGNVIARIGGKGKKLVVDAHMDEVGFMVSHIDAHGFVRVCALGGIDAKVFYGQRVVVHGSKPLGAMVGAIPPHISKTGGDRGVPEIEDCVLDLGLSAAKVKKYVKIGDPVIFDTELRETEDAVIARSIDDRVGIFVILSALAAKPKPACDLFVTLTVQEEPGLRGARVITPAIEPDFVIALEGTVAMDLPGVAPHKSLANIGKGPEVRLSDRYLVADRGLSFFIKSVADKKKIPCQITVKKAGGTNATAMQVTGKGTRAAVVSVPTRYLHSPGSVAYKSDIEAAIKLMKSVIEGIGAVKTA
ncbi:MAG: M42 family peptidase [Candidatus Mycalebacterium zealandia]|nr:MAG: M42 family peptidase [Candidatus Mycalebacterium zealandia]